MVILVPTTRENWQAALRLHVHAQQVDYVPSVAVSLAKVTIRPDGDAYVYAPFCVYAFDQTLVGFVMVTADETTTWSYWLNGLMIDAAHQGKGYGLATMNAVIGYIRARYPQSECLNLTVNPENAVARKLYDKCGFKQTEEVHEGELVYRLVLRPGTGSSR